MSTALFFTIVVVWFLVGAYVALVLKVRVLSKDLGTASDNIHGLTIAACGTSVGFYLHVAAGIIGPDAQMLFDTCEEVASKLKDVDESAYASLKETIDASRAKHVEFEREHSESLAKLDAAMAKLDAANQRASKVRRSIDLPESVGKGE